MRQNPAGSLAGFQFEDKSHRPVRGGKRSGGQPAVAYHRGPQTHPKSVEVSVEVRLSITPPNP